MAKAGPWQVKGVDRKTRRVARDAAARSGVPVGVWIDRAIKARAAIAPRGDAKPLISPAFLVSARAADPEESAGKEPFLPAAPPQPDRPDPSRIDPAIAAASRGPRPGLAGRLIGGALLVALMAGGYWLVDRGPAGAPDVPSNVEAARETAEAAADAPPLRSAAAVAALPAPAPPTRIEKLIAAASGGDAAAQHDLGLIYVRGEGVPRNPALGAEWLEKSAAAGKPEAQYRLGVLHEQGVGVRQDNETAFRWYRRGALQGHLRAQHNLATLYAEGKGTPRNYSEALRWFTRAAQDGLAESHYSLGMMHEHGLGVEKDPRKAATFYRDALAAGSAQAADKLARLEPAQQEEPAAPDAAAAAAGDTQATSAVGDALSPAGIVNLQRLLARLDLGPGPATGVLSDQTVDAIKLYQRFAGLPVDGNPTLELLRDLRQVVGAMATETAAPQPQAAPATAP